MPKQLQITIPEPCHEDWNKMSPSDKGRFCGSCQKQVIDFSSMSDRQLAAFFKKPSAGSVCGRFLSDQLERDIEIPKKRIPWVKYFFQFALPAFLFSMRSSSAKAQGAVSQRIIEQPVKCNKTFIGDTIIVQETFSDKMNKLLANANLCFTEIEKKEFVDIKERDLSIPFVQLDTTVRNITGTITDEKGLPVQSAFISIKGKRTGVSADANGRYSIRAKKDDILVVSCVGFFSTEAIIGNKSVINTSISNVGIYTEVIIVAGGAYSTARPRKNKARVIKKPAIKDSITKIFKAIPSASFKIFPNPVSVGSNITIECTKQGEGYYIFQLLNQSGQSVYQQEVWIDAKTRSLNIGLPSVIAGNYFAVLLNKKSGRKFTEKIIIQ